MGSFSREWMIAARWGMSSKGYTDRSMSEDSNFVTTSFVEMVK